MKKLFLTPPNLLTSTFLPPSDQPKSLGPSGPLDPPHRALGHRFSYRTYAFRYCKVLRYPPRKSPHRNQRGGEGGGISAQAATTLSHEIIAKITP